MRLYDWQSRFAALIKEKQSCTFEWGVNDCGLFACDAIVALTGVDPALSFRGKYDTPLAGAKLLKESGCGSITEFVEKMAEEFGFLEVKPAFAQRGDLGFYMDPKEGETLGINIGPTFAFLGLQGMVYLPRSAISRAWKVE